MAGNEKVVTVKMFLLLHQNMTEAYHVGYQWNCHGILGRSLHAGNKVSIARNADRLSREHQHSFQL